MVKYRADIDGLRAVAVLPVVLYHASVPGLSGGFVGVDVFFVISGFLITSIVMKEVMEGRFSLLRFYERRARRILPALTVVVGSTLFAGWFLLIPSELKTLGQSTVAAAAFASNIFFLAKLDYFAPAAEFAALLHTWSLAVEEQFYLFFPPLLALLFARRGFKVTVLVVATMVAVSLAAAIAILPEQPDWVFYLIFFRAWELGIGALLAMAILPAPRSMFVKNGVGLASLMAILLPVIFYDSSTAFPGLAALPPVLGAAGIIYVGTNGGGGIVSRLLSLRLFVWVGLISYSLYLWHWPILTYLRIVRSQAELPLMVGLGAVLLSIIMAWLSYKFVERPFRAKGGLGISTNKIYEASLGMLGAMVLAGGLLHVAQGAPWRLSPLATKFANVVEDRNPHRARCLSRRPEAGLCEIGLPAMPGQPTQFLFWGDSHADAMAPGLNIAAQNAKQRGLFAAAIGCLPLRRLSRGPDNHECDQLNQEVWSVLKERNDIEIVVLAGRWARTVEVNPYREEFGKPFKVQWNGEAASAPAENDNATLFEMALRADVAEIVSSGREVVLLGQIPEAGWDVPTVMARKAMVPFASLPAEVSAVEFQARAKRSEDILKRVSNELEGVHFVSLGDLFCTDVSCSITDDKGLPIYIDDDHISRAAAERLLPKRLAEIWRGYAE